MARRCSLTGKSKLIGNRVSHSNTKTLHAFMPNLQNKWLYSDILGSSIRLRLTANALRTIDHVGGLDAYLLKTPATKLPPEGALLKKRITKAQARREAASA
jgi:large subunit ribosomal protein L28